MRNKWQEKAAGSLFHKQIIQAEKIFAIAAQSPEEPCNMELRICAKGCVGSVGGFTDFREVCEYLKEFDRGLQYPDPDSLTFEYLKLFDVASNIPRAGLQGWKPVVTRCDAPEDGGQYNSRPALFWEGGDPNLRAWILSNDVPERHYSVFANINGTFEKTWPERFDTVEEAASAFRDMLMETQRNFEIVADAFLPQS